MKENRQLDKYIGNLKQEKKSSVHFLIADCEKRILRGCCKSYLTIMSINYFMKNRLDSLKTNISKTNVKLLGFGEQILQIQSAIQNARKNKKGKLYVNLNAIGKKGERFHQFEE